MKPFIPNDKFNIDGLEACWNYVLSSPNKTDEKYFCELAARTFQLFYHYHEDDVVPKAVLRLIPIMCKYAAEGENVPHSFEDAACAVTRELVVQLTGGFKRIMSPNTGRIEACGEWMAVTYMNEHYQINTVRFDLSPIKEKRAIKF